MKSTRKNAFRTSFKAIAVSMGIAVSMVLMPVAKAADPVKIGFSMTLTGGLAAAGQAALIAMNIWKDDVNAAGGLLGRQVEFVYYDDATNPSKVPGIYTKLINVDKVDLVVSSYGTNLIAPAMPIVMKKKWSTWHCSDWRSTIGLTTTIISRSCPPVLSRRPIGRGAFSTWR